VSDDPKVHLVGIGGAGMSGIARILLQRGGTVSGSDLSEGRALEELRVLGARVDVGHDASQIQGADIVVTSTAVPGDNPEVVAAREAGLTVLRRAEMLARLMEGQQAVLIGGTHGKTTTTSMTVVAMQSAGRDPSFAIGGSLNESGTNAHAGSDPVFVAEADESDRSFLVYRPDLAVVTNVEHDHPDEFHDLDAVAEAFRAFVDRRSVGAPALLCADDPGASALAEVTADPVVLYGVDPGAEVRTVVGGDGQHSLRYDGEEVARFSLGVPGGHNVLNATAALATCVLLGIDPAEAAPGLARFTGAARRFQVLGTAAGVTVVDDYAHHPTELRATLAAARTRDAKRVVVVVQPHRYSRTQSFGEELGRAAAAADVVICTDVYAAGESAVPGVTGRVVAEAAMAAGANVRFRAHLSDVVDELVGLASEGDLVLTTGAGDVTQVGPALLSRLGGTG
jgi:UDP-N-acetylmuramate--alanine ligase